LKGSSITNIAVLIVRYFGGTLLGTGGLVKAYQDAVRAVLDILRTEELVEKTTFSLVIGYEVYDQVKLLLTTLKAQIQEDFGTSITINGTIESQKRLQLTDQIIELTRGTSTVSFH
jgi:putative IMPACT (imprinted ancient) family translation regulator